MERQSITGQKLRQEVKKIIDAVRETEFCSCPKPSSNGLCTHCLRRILVDRLCDKGLSAALCTSKWKHTKQIPGGKIYSLTHIVRIPNFFLFLNKWRVTC